MSREIEFKYRLPDHRSFERLKACFPQIIQTRVQTNSLFDTADYQLSTQSTWLRIREENHLFKLTLKFGCDGEKQKTEALSDLQEYEFSISPDEAQALLAGQVSKPLQLMGSFKNIRTCVPFRVGHCELQLELDETHFGSTQVDYEVELEIPENLSAKEAQTALLELFKRLDLSVKPSTGKAERFFAWVDKQHPR